MNKPLCQPERYTVSKVEGHPRFVVDDSQTGAAYRCYLDGHARALAARLNASQGLLDAARAVMNLAGDDTDLPDNGAFSGAAITDMLREAIAAYEKASP